MTENLAGRGEGLAGLVAKWRDEIEKCCPVLLKDANSNFADASCRQQLRDVEELEAALVVSDLLTQILDFLDEVTPENDTSHWAARAYQEIGKKFNVAALEAAAPASTAHDVHWAIKAECARCRESYPQRHDKPGYISNFGNVEAGDWTHPCTAEHDWRYCQAAKIHEALFVAALATPSPQTPRLTVGNITGVLFNAGVSLTSPVAHRVTDELNAVISWQEQSNAFSTTSAREQSAATASGNLSAADFAEIPATQAVLLGVATDLLERGKEAMECDPQREEVGSDCWIWCHQVTGWLDEVGKLPKTAAATQEQPAGSGAHVGWIAGHCTDPMNCPACKREWAGSPRKVGEDGAGGELWQRLVELQLAHETKYSQLPSGQWAWSCACGDSAESFKNWDECHRRTREHWASVIILALPSSAPVGEQKQEEGAEGKP